MSEPGWASPAPPDAKPDWLTSPPAAAETDRSTSDAPSAPDEEWPTSGGSRVQRSPASAASFSLQDLTVNFFQPLCVSEPILRKAAVDESAKVLRQCATNPTEESMKLLRAHFRTIVRLAQESPFLEIRQVFRELVTFLQAQKLDLPPVPVNTLPQPSYFFQPQPAAAAETPNTDDGEVIRFLQDIFVRTGRVTHVDQVLAWHPSFHEKWFTATHFLLRDAGPLQLPIRNYIAILAAARHKCQYLVRLQEEEFLLNGGDAKWLEGFQEAPKKIQNILPIIAVLAHQPWLLNKDHITGLLRGADSWTVAELVHAICLVVTFTSLASLIFATGITPEIDLPGPELPNAVDSGDERGDVDVIQEQKKILAELLKKRTLKEEKEKEKERVPEESKVEMFVKAGEDALAALHTSPDMASLARYIGPHAMAHIDFDVRSKDYRPLRDADYTWQEQGYSLVSRYYAELAPLIDEEFRHIYNMTYNTFSDTTNIDTSPFRFSIWHYVHRLKGLLHDDYNYRDVNTYLSKQLKTFIKKVACAPETIVKGDLNKMGPFTAAEKVHIVLLATESRKQAELTYGLNALMKHMR